MSHGSILRETAVAGHVKKDELVFDGRDLKFVAKPGWEEIYWQVYDSTQGCDSNTSFKFNQQGQKWDSHLNPLAYSNPFVNKPLQRFPARERNLHLNSASTPRGKSLPASPWKSYTQHNGNDTSFERNKECEQCLILLAEMPPSLPPKECKSCRDKRNKASQSGFTSIPESLDCSKGSLQTSKRSSKSESAEITNGARSAKATEALQSGSSSGGDTHKAHSAKATEALQSSSSRAEDQGDIHSTTATEALQSSSVVAGDAANDEWHLHNIPSELKLTQTNTPAVIRTIVEEFWQECEAIQASARSVREEALYCTSNQADTPLNDDQLGTHPTQPDTLSGNDIKRESQSLFSSLARRSLLISKAFKGKQPVGDSLAQALTFKECASCLDDVPSKTSIDLSCKHSYCPECFGQLVLTAMGTESFWPPRCCLQEIPRSTILRHLSDKQALEFGAKEKEYKTPPNERWYCTNSKCLKFFEAPKHSNWTACTHCRFEMCLYCRGARHEAKERCPQDKNLQATLAEADLEGWRPCYRCGHIIELDTGCRHMTCRCGAQFCYTCGAKWKTCYCTPADDERRRQRVAATRDETRRRREVERIEEAATQAAIEAVAEQQRKEEEQQLLEEKRMFERMEADRLVDVKAYYGYLSSQLQELHEVQLKSVNDRQSGTLASLECELADVKIVQHKLEKSLEATESSCDTAESIRNQHRCQIIEDFRAQHQFQAAVIERFDTFGQESEKAEYASEIELILSVQHEKRKARDERFARRLENLRNSDEYERREHLKRRQREHEEYLKSKEKLDVELTDATRQIELAKQRFKFEQEWMSFASTERLNILKEDEIRFTQSGADAPSYPGKMSTEDRGKLEPKAKAPQVLSDRALIFESPKRAVRLDEVGESSATGAARNGAWIPWFSRV